MILVAGAGPGGLCAALALQGAGLEVRVWERADVLRTDGAGITVQINAMRMLAALGVTDTLRERGAVLDSGEVSDHRGRTIHLMPFGSFAKRFEQVGIGIHRGELSRTLADALEPGTVVFSRGVAEIEQQADGVTVVDEAGERERFDAVVGADGIHSAVRTACFGDVPIRYAGYTCWRGIAPLVAPGGPGHSNERWGPGRRVGTVPIAKETTYWFATESGPPDGVDGPDPRKEMLERFRDFDAAARDVLAATPNDAILRNDIIDFAPIATWTKGRVTLLGDAAHAMTPNLGQGACQAIEDAVVLAASLREHGLPDGLTAYEQQRRPRTERFVVDSYRFGSLAQLSNGVVRWLRDSAFRLFATERAMQSRLDDIYGVPVPDIRSC